MGGRQDRLDAELAALATLSPAQLREQWMKITGRVLPRVRDKIAASKARGMWMGGTPPLGYRPDGRSLAIVEDDADIVRDIFARYLELGNVRKLYHALLAEEIGVPQRTASTGRTMGGCPFTRGQIHRILINPIYVGEIHHQGRVANGLHSGIIDRTIWDRVQAQLADNLQGDRSRSRIGSPSLLAGLTVDEAGEPLVAAHANKGKVRYRYYVSRALQHEPGSHTGGMRIPAREIETAVAERVAEALDDPLALLASAGIAPAPDEIRTAMASAQKLAAAARKKDRQLIRGLVTQVRVTPREVRIELAVDTLAKRLGLDAPGNDNLKYISKALCKKIC